MQKCEKVKKIFRNYKIIKKIIPKQEQRPEENQGEVLVLWRKISAMPRPESSIHDLISLIKDVKQGVKSKASRVRAGSEGQKRKVCRAEQ